MDERKKVISIIDARQEIEGNKAIFVITDENDMVNLKGYIDYISKDRTTYNTMLDRFHQLGDMGIDAMLIGNYENGGDFHVKYIV